MGLHAIYYLYKRIIYDSYKRVIHLFVTHKKEKFITNIKVIYKSQEFFMTHTRELLSCS